jgi:Uma2 family endonuclease
MSLLAQEFAELMPDGQELLSDEPEMESSLHYTQLALLVSGLEWLWRDRDDFFIGANLTVYYSREQLRHRDFRGPDFFVVRQTRRHPRNSWVVWEEQGRYPDLIVELLSNSTEKVDRTTKKQLYQDRFRTPEYFWFHPETLELAGFRLLGSAYRPILGTERDWRWSEQLGLYLGVHEGQLRYFSPEGELIPTLEESVQRGIERIETERARADRERARAEQEQTRAEQEQKRAEQEHQRADQEHRRAERMAARLRALGIEPE